MNNGQLSAYADGALGSGAGSTNVANGATLCLYSPYGMTYSTVEPVTINGSGYNPGTGAMGALYSTNVANQNAVNTFFGPVTAATSSTINVDATSTLALAGGINIASNATLMKAGGGTLTVSGSQTNGAGAILTNPIGIVNLNSNGGSALTVVTSGSSAVTNFGAAQTLAGVTLSSNAMLNLISGNSTANTLNVGVGTLNTNANSLTISGASSITGTLTKTGNGALNLNGALTSSGNLNVNAGSVAAANIDGGNTTLAAGSSLTANHIIQNALTVGTNATVTINPSSPSSYGPGAGTVPSGSSSGTSILSSLSIANNGLGTYYGKVDLQNNNLVINYTGTSPLDSIRDAIKSAYHGGLWDGLGLTSSMIAAYPTAQFALGYGENNDSNTFVAFNATTSLFEGTPVNAQSLLVKFTWQDDLNLDGIVDITDASTFGNNFDFGATPGHTFAQGDLNYDGYIDITDSAIFGNAFNTSLQHLPEPSTFVLAILGLAGLLALRRRRK